MTCIAQKPAALSPQRFSPLSESTSPKSKLMSVKAPTPAKPAALTPARPEQPTMPTPNTAEHAAAGKKDCPTLTSRTLAGPNAPSKAQTGARARDAKSMPKATGRWTADEDMRFLACLDIFGRKWKKAAEIITTRTVAQIRSHAQKHFIKLEAAGKETGLPADLWKRCLDFAYGQAPTTTRASGRRPAAPPPNDVALVRKADTVPFTPPQSLPPPRTGLTGSSHKGGPSVSDRHWAAAREGDMPEKRPPGIVVYYVAVHSGIASWRHMIKGVTVGTYATAAQAWAAYQGRGNCKT